MANDRLFLICKHCGERTGLLKYYPGPYNPRARLQSYAYDVSEFVEKHVGCSPNAGTNDLGDDDCFIVRNEHTFDMRH